MAVVLSIGGSVLGYPVDVDVVRGIAETLNNYRGALGVVVGGGPIARGLMSAVKNKAMKDLVGIYVSRANALVFSSFLKKGVYTEDILRARELMLSGLVPVLGGMFPGMTTDGVAAALAELTEATFINVTKIGGIIENGKIIRKIKASELLKKLRTEPGTHFPIDAFALGIIIRSNVPTYIVGPDALKDALEGKIRGTEILPE